jgi:CPA2 family monovalent cation:H+ antiporter-2
MTLVTTLTVIFLAASGTLYIMQYFDHPAIPGYVLAGLIVAPFIAGASLLELAQVGILFLLFIFGLKFDPEELSSVATSTILAAMAQIIITGSVGYAVAAKLGFTGFEALVLAVTCAMSSTLIGLDLAEQEIHRRLLHGRLAESMHLVQDMLGLVILAVLFASSPREAVNAGVLTVAFILVSLGLRRYVFPFIGENIDYNAEILMLLGFSSLILSVYTAGFFGLPLFIGAFTAGIAAAQFPYNMELLDSMGSVKDFFAAVFFVTLGALVGWPTVTTAIIATVVFAVNTVLKPYVAAEIFKVSGYTDRASVLAGLSLSQVSELALILAIQGVTTGLISPVLFDGIILGGVASMFVSSYVKANEEVVYDHVSGDRHPSTSLGVKDHIIVIGASTAGRHVVETLVDHGVENLVVVDNDAERLQWAKQFGEVTSVHGDVMNDDVRTSLNMADAELIVSTALQQRVSERVLDHASHDTVLYASTAQGAQQLYKDGATVALVPDIAVADILEDVLDGAESKKGRIELQQRGKALLREMYPELQPLD